MNKVSSDFFNAGQPIQAPVGRKRFAESMYRLGKTVAATEQQKTENDQTAALNMIQQMMVFKSKQELLDILADVKRNQRDLNMQLMQQAAPIPPMPGGVPMGGAQGGIPPFPAGVGSPQGGIPPFPQGAGGGSPDMQGGGIPPPNEPPPFMPQ